MNENLESAKARPLGNSSNRKAPGRWFSLVLAGGFSWICMTAGFYGLNLLMQVRPQFAGQPVRFSNLQLVQESPDVVLRKVHDDVSVLQPIQPQQTQVSSSLKARRDYRGVTELELPQTGATIGTFKWIVVLPSGFRTQVISSGLDLQRQPPDLGSFGDYGRVLKTHPQLFFLKNLLPPIPVHVNLKYYQQVAGVNSELVETDRNADR